MLPPARVPPSISPMRSMPAENFGRSFNKLPEVAPSGGGGGSTPLQPFDVTSTGSGTITASIEPGTINGLLPTNYNSTFPLDDTLVYYLVLSVTATDGEIASCTLSFPTSAPAGVPTVLGQPPTAFDYLLGIVSLGVWYRTIGPGSLTAVGQEMFRIDKTSPAPGTLPYEIYYSWAISPN